MNNTNSNSNTSCALNNNNSNISSPVNVPNVQSPNSQLSQQSKMTDSHQSIDDQIQRTPNQLQSHQQPHPQQQIPQSQFTIEQIELIRRLRKTNLTIDQFIEAYSEMERLEEEMDKKDNSISFDNTASSITYALNNSNSQHQIMHQQLMPGHYQNSHNQLASLTNHYNNLQNQPNQLNNSFPTDDNIELSNFKKKGEQEMLLEIRSFVSKYNVRQSMISEATGISQGYISTFFHGEKMSEKRKNIIYQWYLTYSKNPAKLAADRQQMSLNNSSNSKFNHDFSLDNSNHHFGSNNDVLFPITRRDRFIFRKQHLKILERFFDENPYPEIHAKEQIVEECNLSAEKSSGKPLKEADKVTVAIVSNWFNNKRKNARSKHLKNYNSSSNNSLNNLALGSHSLNSSTGSANLSQSSNAGYNNLQNSPTPASSAYLGIQQQQQQLSQQQQQQTHQLQQQQNHQDANFESNYAYECGYNQNNQNSNSQSQAQQQQQTNQSDQMHIVRNPSTGIQNFKNEPQYNYLDNCFNKIPNASSTKNSDNETDLGHDHDGSNISEFSSQASYNGNDSIDN